MGRQRWALQRWHRQNVQAESVQTHQAAAAGALLVAPTAPCERAMETQGGHEAYLNSLNQRLYALQQRVLSAPRSERRSIKAEAAVLDAQIAEVHEKLANARPKHGRRAEWVPPSESRDSAVASSTPQRRPSGAGLALDRHLAPLSPQPGESVARMSASLSADLDYQVKTACPTLLAYSSLSYRWVE